MQTADKSEKHKQKHTCFIFSMSADLSFCNGLRSGLPAKKMEHSFVSLAYSYESLITCVHYLFKKEWECRPKNCITKIWFKKRALVRFFFLPFNYYIPGITFRSPNQFRSTRQLLMRWPCQAGKNTKNSNHMPNTMSIDISKIVL